MKIAVIGGGAWGTALALVARKNGHEVTLWAREPEVVDEIRKRRATPFLRDVALDPQLRATGDLAEAAGAGDWLLLAVPSHVMRAVSAQLKDAARDKPVLSVTKGIETDTGKRMSEVIAETLGGNPFAALSGPSFAHDVARGKPTAVAVASAQSAWAEQVQKALSGSILRLYTSNDVIGVELGGSMKNVMAIAAGVSDGLGLGESARASLITRGLAEMVRIGERLGGRRETFFGLSGLGDLVLTCGGQQSRNHTVGERLGRGETLAQITGSMTAVAEGVKNAESFHRVVTREKIEAPIIREVHGILYEGIKPAQALENLMKRDLKRE